MPTEPSPSTRFDNVWPALPQAAWSDTCATLQLWMQIVGKIRLALTPAINHTWNVTLYPTVRGLTTSPMPYADRMLQIDFDFIEHVLLLETSEGGRRTISLKPMTVAAFYQQVMSALDELNTPVHIWQMPVEIAQPIPFEQDYTPPGLRRRICAALLAHITTMHAGLHPLSCSLHGQGEPGTPFLGSARPRLHPVLRPRCA